MPVAVSVMISPTVCPASVRAAKRGGSAATTNGSTVSPASVPSRSRQRGRRPHLQSRHPDIGEGTGHRQQSRVLGDHALDRRRGIHLQGTSLAQEHQAERVVQFSIGEHDALDGHVAIAGGRMAVELLHLVPDVGRCIEEEPVRPVGADGGRRLGSRKGGARIEACGATSGTPAIPLRESTTCSRSQQYDLHLEKRRGPAFASPRRQSCCLQGRDVSGDFHRNGDDLCLWLGPTHGSSSTLR